MRSFKMASMLFILALAISAFTSAAASAALPEILDHVPSTFTATSGAGELVDPATGLNIKCEKDTITLANGKLLTAKTMEAVVDFEQCQSSGFAAVSLGDKTDEAKPKLGLILVPVKGELCYINEAKKEVGVYFKIPPLHIEVPAAAILMQIIEDAKDSASSVIGTLTPVNELKTGPYTLTINKTSPKECFVGGVAKKALILIELEHNGKPLDAEEVTTETITFDEDEIIMA